VLDVLQGLTPLTAFDDAETEASGGASGLLDR